MSTVESHPLPVAIAVAWCVALVACPVWVMALLGVVRVPSAADFGLFAEAVSRGAVPLWVYASYALAAALAVRAWRRRSFLAFMAATPVAVGASFALLLSVSAFFS